MCFEIIEKFKGGIVPQKAFGNRILEKKDRLKEGRGFQTTFALYYAKYYSIFTRFNLNALLNTETELAAIAAPAMTGFKKPSAASGMPKIL